MHLTSRQRVPYSDPCCRLLQANPDPSTCLGVFGLSLYTTERDLREVFSHYGPLAGVNVVYDQRTGRSRGFAFIYFERLEDSREVRVNICLLVRREDGRFWSFPFSEPFFSLECLCLFPLLYVIRLVKLRFVFLSSHPEFVIQCV